MTAQRITPTTLFVCPTSHLDWDWLTDFEQYYGIGYSGGSNNPVRYTLQQMLELLEGSPGAPSTFRFSLAEMGYFERYFVDTPGARDRTLAAGHRLCLMGGGVVSPDNLISHGEAFVRNYLLGTNWLASQGLEGLRDPLAWLPDDFGHDPQLPVLLSAMGMVAVGFSRVPGSPQPTPTTRPLDGSPTVDQQLNDTEGLVFAWTAADGSQVVAHFMPSTYLVSPTALDTFVSSFSGSVWNGPNMFAPVPTPDFATPTASIESDVATYNLNPTDGVVAQLATFQEFVDAVLAEAGDLPSGFTLQASNYWTGQFASRPQLKIDHFAAVRDLLAAEAASTLLRVLAPVSTSVLDALDGAVDRTWWSVARSTHHDFITGTSPDQTYALEQLPLSTQTRSAAAWCREQAVGLLAESIPSGTGSAPRFVVFNSLGFARGGLVAISGVESGYGGFTTSDGQSGQLQRGADGDLLFVLDSVPSLGYTTVTLTSGTPQTLPLPAVGNSAVLDSGTVEATFYESLRWGLYGLVDCATGIDPILQGIGANALRWYHDGGNLYQFGNEIDGSASGFQERPTVPASLGARITENGPVRWRLEAGVRLSESSTGLSEDYQIVYTLIAGEPFVRIEVTGRAPDAQSAVVAAFNVGQISTSTRSDGLTHGTTYHWTDVEPVPYWHGPTFQATHDYVLPTLGGEALAAIYQSGMPAWCRDQDNQQNDFGLVLGVLFRSADGKQRGAAGTDPDRHTQSYALGVPGTAGLDPATCGPLQLGESFATPLFARRVPTEGTRPTRPWALPATAQLAAVTAGEGMIRAVRTQPGSQDPTVPTFAQTQGVPTAFVLRLYTPTNQATSLTVDLPWQSSQQPVDAGLVTALERPIEANGLPQPASSVSTSGGTVDVDAGQAITTLRIATRRPFVAGTDGK
ncbi:MAG TPA: hypothetical protein VHQ65_05170 [Thermoanaerobaculia bacterium]|nr:hypothetical protein [Thermoanaerobaculia bacterium]